MAYTEKFREQHDKLLEKAGEISKHLDEDVLAKDAKVMRDMLSGLLGNLKIHLAVEDKALYPKLKNSGNPEIVAVAIQYQEEMGGIAESVNNYSKKWPSAYAISDNAKLFIEETKQLISALGTRIKKENEYLYKLADDFL